MQGKIIQTGFPITQCVVEGKQHGVIFEVGDAQFVLHKSGFGSLINSEDCDWKVLLNLFKSDAFPQYFHIYDATEKLIDFINKFRDTFNYRVRTRYVLTYQKNDKLPIYISKDWHIEPILLEQFPNLKSIPIDLEEKYWNGKFDFIDHAMGYVAWDVMSRLPLSICYSAATCKGKAEVDIWTNESFRGNGIGKSVASLFINNCLDNQIIPNWDCFEENLKSLNLAKSLLFNIINKYKIISIFKNIN